MLENSIYSNQQEPLSVEIKTTELETPDHQISSSSPSILKKSQSMHALKLPCKNANIDLPQNEKQTNTQSIDITNNKLDSSLKLKTNKTQNALTSCHLLVGKVKHIYENV